MWGKIIRHRMDMKNEQCWLSENKTKNVVKEKEIRSWQLSGHSVKVPSFIYALQVGKAFMV